MHSKRFISFILLFTALFLFIFQTPSANAADNADADSDAKAAIFESHIQDLYNSITFKKSRPEYALFRKAYIGYLNLKAENKLSDKNVLTIIDFRLSSTKERLWSINLNNKKVVYESLVSHGRNSGDEFAKKFSNVNESNMSSYGFYVTGDTYTGKHGLSLYLDGVDAGYNSNARDRNIVMHSAEYANADFIKKTGRLGRSLGCPAIPEANHKEVINTLENKTCLFIYYPDSAYEKKSKLLSQLGAMNHFLSNMNINSNQAVANL